MHKEQHSSYSLTFFCNFDEINPHNGNFDVEIEFRDGRRYCPTFFTLANIHVLMKQYKTTGECADGAYFWAAGMIVVEQLTPETVRKAIADMVDGGELKLACKLLANRPEPVCSKLD